MTGKFFVAGMALAAFTGSASASIILTGIIDGNGSTPKGIEVYVDADGDYTNWTVAVEANANTTPSTAHTFSGTLTAGFYYITSTDTDMIATFASATASNTFANGSFNQNGDDRFFIFDGSSTLIDQYGVAAQDGTGESWEYTDSYAYRVDGTGPDGSFVETNWMIPGADFIDDNGGDNTLAPFGTYVVPEPASAALMGLGALAMLRRRSA